MHEGHDGECDEELLDLFGDFERVIFFVCCVDFGYVVGIQKVLCLGKDQRRFVIFCNDPIAYQKQASQDDDL